jgi:hypothetical protein
MTLINANEKITGLILFANIRAIRGRSLGRNKFDKISVAEDFSVTVYKEGPRMTLINANKKGPGLILFANIRAIRGRFLGERRSANDAN